MAVNQNFKESTVSTTNHTQNYDLPLWTDGDKTSWLTQVNDAMNKIDSGMVDAKSKALEVVGIAADAKKLADETAAESKASAEIVAGYNDRLTAVEKTSAEHTDDITALNTRCDQMDTEIHSLQETQKKTTEDLGTLADQVKHNKEDADNTAQAVTTLNGTVVELTGRVTTCEEEIEALQTAQGSQGENITNLTQEVDTLKTTVDGHTASINNLSIRVAKNESDISKTNTNLTNLSTNVESEIGGLDTRVTALESGSASGGGNSIKVKTRYTGTLSTDYYAGGSIGSNLKCDYLIFEDGSEAIDLYFTGDKYTEELFTTTGQDTRNVGTFPIVVKFNDMPNSQSITAVSNVCAMIGMRYSGETVSGVYPHAVLLSINTGSTSKEITLVFCLTDVTKTPVGKFYSNNAGGTWRFIIRGEIS